MDSSPCELKPGPLKSRVRRSDGVGPAFFKPAPEGVLIFSFLLTPVVFRVRKLKIEIRVNDSK